MDRLHSMRVFCRVIDAGSFASAAREMNLSPAVVTRLVADLEEHLGARLINRTTRRLALTDAGEGYLERVRQILLEIDEAEALAGASVSAPRGHLRVLVPPALAVHQLAKHLPRFYAMYPQVTLDIAAPGPVEAVDESFDVTIVAARKLPDGDFTARRLARSEVITCASTEYLNRRGRPQHPSELTTHDVVKAPFSEAQRGMTFYSRAPASLVSDAARGDEAHGDAHGEAYSVAPPRSVLSTAHVETIYAAALAGLGIAALPSFVVEDALHQRALERVLPHWTLFSSTLWAAMPTRKHVPARTRAFVDFLVQTFGGDDRDPWLLAAGGETHTPLPANEVTAAPPPGDAVGDVVRAAQ